MEIVAVASVLEGPTWVEVLVEWDSEALELLRVLAREAPRPMKASRGTWLLREISEPGRKAA